MKKSNKMVAPDYKLTDSQIEEIRKYLPYGFFTKLAETRDGITRRQMIEVMTQRTNDAKKNKIVWTAIKKKLTAANRHDLVLLVDKRIFFCNNWLSV